jgi:hypothetical protein
LNKLIYIDIIMADDHYDTEEDIEQMEKFVITERIAEDDSKEKVKIISRDNRIQCLLYKRISNITTLAAIFGIFIITPIVSISIGLNNTASYNTIYQPRYFKLSWAVLVILWLIVLSKY